MSGGMMNLCFIGQEAAYAGRNILEGEGYHPRSEKIDYEKVERCLLLVTPSQVKGADQQDQQW